MKNLKANLVKKDQTVEIEITSAEELIVDESAGEAGYMKVPASEKEQHQKYIANCMSHAKDSVDTEGLDDDRAYMACAIAYDKEYKTAYAPCVPGVGCMY